MRLCDRALSNAKPIIQLCAPKTDWLNIARWADAVHEGKLYQGINSGIESFAAQRHLLSAQESETTSLV